MDFTITRKKGGVISWSEDQVHYIINEYLNNSSIKVIDLAKLFGVRAEAIRRLLRKNNIELLGSKRGFPRDVNYFSQINSKEKAYWLGYIYADGCVSNMRNTLSITSTDFEHLEKFKLAIGSINKIIPMKDNRFENAKQCFIFGVNDAKIKQDLINLGCVPNKSLLLKSIPNIDKDLISHFLRGYFDGDGSLHWTANKFRVSFVGTYDFLVNIRSILGLEQLSLNQNMLAKDTYQLQISGKNDVKRILQFLYLDSEENIRLNRKYDKSIECLSMGASLLNL